ncbi:MAG: hypothetical protein D3903_05395 [Candidatus Electrothrix sp. GM3_4]|nr:hypothetical protein [Candidatus Electrothrix sp. GM3_4]
MFLENNDKENKWININEQLIKFNGSLFWYHTPVTDYNKNENSKITISIPKENLLTKESFQKICSEYSIQPL